MRWRDPSNVDRSTFLGRFEERHFLFFPWLKNRLRRAPLRATKAPRKRTKNPATSQRPGSLQASGCGYLAFTFTSTFRGLDLASFASVTVNTPSLYSAPIFSASADSGSVKLRTNFP